MMKVTLIITTYKRPNALKLVLNSILTQSVLPGEIIIGDELEQLVNPVLKEVPSGNGSL